MIRARFLVVFLLVSMMVSSASAYFVGTTPGTQDLGDVERGESYELKMYLTSNAQAPLNIRPDTSRVSHRFIGSDKEDVSHSFEPDQASQQKITDWVEFDEESFILNPDQDSRVTLDSGETISADRTINYKLNVPRDAEPGYHAVKFNLNPELQRELSGSLQTRSISNPALIFRVPGEAERELTITDIEGLRSGDSTARILMTVENTGTVTARITEGDFNIVDDGNQEESVILGQNYYLKPGETKQIDTTWDQAQEDIQAGNYRLKGKINYMTGQAFIDDTFSISDFIQIRPSDNESDSEIVPSGESEEQMPTMLILMFLVLMGSIMYVFEIDPLFIVIAIGVLSVSAFIWFSGLPMFWIALVLLMSAGIIYYGWM